MQPPNDSNPTGNLQQLDPQGLEVLVGILLNELGYKILEWDDRARGRGDRFADFEAVSPEGIRTFVEVKAMRRQSRVPTTYFRRFTGDISRFRQQDEKIKAIFATNSDLPDPNKEILSSANVDLWDRTILENLVADRPRSLAAALQDQHRRDATSRQTNELLTGPVDRQTSSTSLIDEVEGQLASILPGREDWKKFEETATEILTKLFNPHLGPPEIQNRTDDGLDIMDAIFPIRSYQPPWSFIRQEHQTRFVVAEFKNYTQEISQGEVRSISDYLLEKALRNFGLLISRQNPSKSAKEKRRKEWMEKRKMIVFLSDQDLIDMARYYEEGDDPFQVIEQQTEEFFRTLTT
ncbi:restriction endonuclease [Rhodococcus sp. JS3073]|uniref:restriction endonuclease n=1 Tax=Rhodococcus sp. JS3073 TaxID=3002901 RepID=UPI0022861A08|nr:restriction endonuclease [Rhodococcus sp. JS3073]WAM19505.1 restriction endonuclease [Rhodococcus sp. JS3073]